MKESKNAKTNSKEKTMSFLDHLEELRWHIIRATIAVVLLGLIAFIFKGFIFDVLIFGPKNADFPTYKLFCKVARAVGRPESFCFDELPFKIQSRKMADQFSAHIWTSITAGIVVGFPYIIYEFWKFISPGLHDSERNTARGFIIVASLLFFTGVLFGYYVITPLTINFLGTYTVSSHVLNEFDLNSYISVVRTAVLASGLIFELPIIIYFLTKIGLVTPEILRKYRKISIVMVLILSAIITPPDVASQIIVAIPIFILYEISIYISAAVIRKQEREAKQSS